jgi:hypothetical protein
MKQGMQTFWSNRRVTAGKITDSDENFLYTIIFLQTDNIDTGYVYSTQRFIVIDLILSY